MGSGLIWAGIGKGISDAGDSFGRFMLADIADRRQAAREDAYAARQEKSYEAQAERQAARDAALLDRQDAAAKAAQEKAEALERLKAKLAEEKLEATRTRAKSDLVEIGKRADEAEVKRDAPQLEADTQRLAGLSSQIKGKSPSTTPEQFAELIKQNPQYRDVYRAAGYIEGAGDPGQRALRRIDDESKAAIEIGADQNIINYYKDVRTSVLKQIELQNKQEQFDAKLPIEQQKAEAATINANRPRPGRGGSGSSPKVRLEAQAETLRKAIKDERDPNRRAALKADLDNVLRQMREARGDSNPSPAVNPAPGGKDQRPPLDSFRK
jgi:hypothetical protein